MSGSQLELDPTEPTVSSTTTTWVSITTSTKTATTFTSTTTTTSTETLEQSSVILALLLVFFIFGVVLYKIYAVSQARNTNSKVSTEAPLILTEVRDWNIDDDQDVEVMRRN